MVNISIIDYYIPDAKLDVENFIDTIDGSSVPTRFTSKDLYGDYLKNELGIKSFSYHEGSKKEFLIEAFHYFFEHNNIDKNSIDLIILAKDINSKEEMLSHFIRYKFGLENADILNMSGSQCANIEAVIHYIATSGNSNYQNILIYSYNKSEKLSDRIIGTYALEGDAVGFVLVSTHKSTIEYIDSLKSINSSLHEANFENDYSLLHCRMYLETLKAFFTKHSSFPEELTKIILQNGNTQVLEQCLRAVRCKEETYFTSPILSLSGHLDCIDFVVSMKSLLDNHVKGYVLSYGIGWKGVYILTLFKFM